MLNEDPAVLRSEDCLSDLQLDQLEVGELEGEAHDAVAGHLQTCARCQARRDELAADEEALPPLQLPDGPSEAPAPTPIRGGDRRLGVIVVGILAAAAIVFFILRRPPAPRSGDASKAPLIAATRLKGGASIGAYVQRKGRVEAWAAGDPLAAGDALSFTYSTDIDQTLGVFLVQDRTIEILHQEDGKTAHVRRGRDVELGLAIELDAEDAGEVAVAVFCLEPTPAKTLRLSLAVDPSAKKLPPGCGATALSLRRSP